MDGLSQGRLAPCRRFNIHRVADLLSALSSSAVLSSLKPLKLACRRFPAAEPGKLHVGHQLGPDPMDVARLARRVRRLLRNRFTICDWPVPRLMRCIPSAAVGLLSGGCQRIAALTLAAVRVHERARP
jgi:hypothetical protein